MLSPEEYYRDQTERDRLNPRKCSICNNEKEPTLRFTWECINKKWVLELTDCDFCHKENICKECRQDYYYDGEWIATSCNRCCGHRDR